MNNANKITYLIFSSSWSIVIKIHVCHIDIKGRFPRSININKELQVLSEKIPVDELQFIESRGQALHSDMGNTQPQ